MYCQCHSLKLPCARCNHPAAHTRTHKQDRGSRHTHSTHTVRETKCANSTHTHTHRHTGTQAHTHAQAAAGRIPLHTLSLRFEYTEMRVVGHLVAWALRELQLHQQAEWQGVPRAALN